MSDKKEAASKKAVPEKSDKTKKAVKTDKAEKQTKKSKKEDKKDAVEEDKEKASTENSTNTSEKASTEEPKTSTVPTTTATSLASLMNPSTNPFLMMNRMMPYSNPAFTQMMAAMPLMQPGNLFGTNPSSITPPTRKPQRPRRKRTQLKNMTEEQKKEEAAQLKEKNRLAAAESRKRKLAHTQQLETENETLKRQLFEIQIALRQSLIQVHTLQQQVDPNASKTNPFLPPNSTQSPFPTLFPQMTMPVTSVASQSTAETKKTADTRPTKVAKTKTKSTDDDSSKDAGKESA